MVLAGGMGRRLGGAKASALLGNRPLVTHALTAMRIAGLPTMLVAKRAVPDIGEDVRMVIEPAEPLHPLMGVLTALELTRAAVVVCAGDMPFVPPALFRALADHPHPGAVVTSTQRELQPLLGRYGPELIPALRAAVAAGSSARGFVRELGESAVIVGDAFLAGFGDPTRMMLDVDTPDDLSVAASWLTDGKDPAGFPIACPGDDFDR